MDGDDSNGINGENMRRVERSSPLWVSTLYGFDSRHTANLVPVVHTSYLSRTMSVENIFWGDFFSRENFCQSCKLVSWKENSSYVTSVSSVKYMKIQFCHSFLLYMLVCRKTILS